MGCRSEKLGKKIEKRWQERMKPGVNLDGSPWTDTNDASLSAPMLHRELRGNRDVHDVG